MWYRQIFPCVSLSSSFTFHSQDLTKIHLSVPLKTLWKAVWSCHERWVSWFFDSIISNTIMFPLLSPQVTTQSGAAGRVLEPPAGKRSTTMNVSSSFFLLKHVSQWNSLNRAPYFLKSGSDRCRQLVRVKWDRMSFEPNRGLYVIKA